MNAFEIIDGELMIDGVPQIASVWCSEYHCGARIPLANRYSVSVVFHAGTYSDGGKTTAETAVFRPDGKFLYSHDAGQVEGYQTPAQVFATMERVEATYA
jgi:hypothetical protein